MKNEIKNILNQYGEMLASYENLYNGSSNVNWKVHTSSGTYVLKRMPMLKTDEFIGFQNWLSTKLVEIGFPFTPNIFTNDGSTVLVYDSFMWQLRNYVTGRFHKLGDISDTQSCIKALVKLHSIEVDKNETIEEFDYWLSDGEEKLKCSADLIRKYLDSRTFSLMIKHYENVLNNIVKSGYQKVKFKNAINHGDFHSGNLIFNASELKTVIDWDTSKIGPRVCDLAKALYLLSRFRHGSFSIDTDMAESFLDQYNKQLNLSNEEICLIPLVLAAAYIPKPDYLLSFGRNNDKLRWYINWTYNGSEMAECQLRPIVDKFLVK